MSPVKTASPVGESLWIATLCGIPESRLSKLIVKAWPAAASSFVVWNWTPWATTPRGVPPGAADAAPDGAVDVSADGAADAAPLAPGATDGAALGVGGGANVQPASEEDVQAAAVNARAASVATAGASRRRVMVGLDPREAGGSRSGAMLEAVGGRGERGPMRRAIGRAEVYRPTDPGVFSPVPDAPIGASSTSTSGL